MLMGTHLVGRAETAAYITAFFDAGREGLGPKIVVPTRIIVEPARTASRQSPDMPIESVDPPTLWKTSAAI